MAVTDMEKEKNMPDTEAEKKEDLTEEEQNTPETEPDNEPETKQDESPGDSSGKDAEASPKSEEEAAEPEKEKSAKEKEKKGFHKKGKEDKKTEALNAKISELEDKVKRQLAEFENFRNRSEKEKSAMFETGARSVIEKILPVVDNFERGLSGLSEEEKEQPFAAGMVMIYKQLQTELENLGVKPIEAVGQEFDPNFHNAVMQVESEEYESGIVAQEMMKGYTYRDNVIRHSMVAVVT